MVRNFILGLILIVFAAACSTKEKPTEATIEAKPSSTPTVNQMPAFEITQTDGKKVSFRDMNGKVLMVLFNPSCDHCQREAKMLSENKSLVKDYEVYFISPEPLDSISKFSYDYKLVEPNIHFGQGNGPQIVQAVGPVNQVPTLVLYNNQMLVRKNEGEMALEKLIEFLK